MSASKENYLERCPVCSQSINWTLDDGLVTLCIENIGVFNRIAQKFFKKPKMSYIHLDKMGSFVWPLIDGKKTIFEIGESVKKQFGEEAEPIYERLAQHFHILNSYGFVYWKYDKNNSI